MTAVYDEVSRQRWEAGLPMSTDAGDGAAGPITAAEWLTLADLDADVAAVLDADGVCTWTSGAPWVGRSLRDVILADDAPSVGVLLAPEPTGPLWLRRPMAGDDVVWWHATSTPRAGGGWVVQLRETRSVDWALQADAHGLDEVTGVAGRERILHEIGFLLSATPRTGKETAVACCGLDEFSELSHRLGVEASDEVLRVMAGRIVDALRADDVVARLDDDTLLVVLRGIHHLRGAMRVANKIRVAAEDPVRVYDRDVVQTVSVGVTLISRGESVDSVLERAQGAMMMAKDSGGNHVVSSPPI
jgi:diguanylate cyclase (GGDEF)-like protein